MIIYCGLAARERLHFINPLQWLQHIFVSASGCTVDSSLSVISWWWFLSHEQKCSLARSWMEPSFNLSVPFGSRLKSSLSWILGAGAPQVFLRAVLGVLSNNKGCVCPSELLMQKKLFSCCLLSGAALKEAPVVESCGILLANNWSYAWDAFNIS